MEGILDRVNQVLSQLQLQNDYSNWIRGKYSFIENYFFSSSIGVEMVDQLHQLHQLHKRVDQAYRGGLYITITQEFRTYRKINPQEVNKLDDSEYLISVIIGYTVDFFRSLRLSQRLGINPNIALDIASLSYHYNPTKLIELIHKFQNVNLKVIEYAALHYPRNPEKFLTDFIETATKLSQGPRFSGVPESEIWRAAYLYS